MQGARGGEPWWRGAASWGRVVPPARGSPPPPPPPPPGSTDTGSSAGGAIRASAATAARRRAASLAAAALACTRSSPLETASSASHCSVDAASFCFLSEASSCSRCVRSAPILATSAGVSSCLATVALCPSTSASTAASSACLLSRSASSACSLSVSLSRCSCSWPMCASNFAESARKSRLVDWARCSGVSPEKSWSCFSTSPFAARSCSACCRSCAFFESKTKATSSSRAEVSSSPARKRAYARER
mmetsp:Transcript_33784/g.103305  ORF Transcript_33784/g.103305 Transcript_33784/m.103305 type:complete len:247 (-) Transcript_33784:649-1389(-)